MRLKAFRKIGDKNPIDQDVSVVLVEGSHGQPVMVACDLGVGNGSIHAAHAGDPDFNRVLQALGFDKLVVTNILDEKLKKPDELPKLTEGFQP